MSKAKITILYTAAVAAAMLAPGLAPAQTGRAESARAKAYHLLNRITYGPRPGDVDRVLSLGIDRYIAQQLHPESLSDDATTMALRDVPILNTSTSTLAALFREQRRARLARQRDSSDSAPRAPTNDLGRLLAEYPKVTLTRAVTSERQLYEVMVDFWTNHFNVFSGKGTVRYLLPEYIEKTIRPHALGRFEDLLVATAQSPAMLVYLDNVQSVAPGAEPPQLRRAQQMARNSRQRGRRASNNRGMGPTEEQLAELRERLPKGINENYARELLELHTLGVDGGYTQHDVVDVARIFTGWSVAAPVQRESSDFVFNAWAHDTEAKTVMGVNYPAGRGMNEGIALLRRLAQHPSTMRHISAKLCTRFVLDEPPDGCVDDAVHAWQQSDGDIPTVLLAIIQSDEFWESEGRKTKTPLEFVVSSLRALNGVPDATLALPQVVRRLGQPLYGHESPTGYPETQADWVNAGALLNRFNVALRLAAGRLPGAVVDLDPIIPPNADLETMLRAANGTILQGFASQHTLSVWREQARAQPPAEQRAFIVGLAIGSPEFQRQ